MSGAEHHVRIESLNVTIEVDPGAGEEAFAKLFVKYAARRDEALRRAEADRCFAEAQRLSSCEVR